METQDSTKPLHPFPQAKKNNYKIMPIKPTRITQEEMDAAIIRQFKQLVDNEDITIDPGTVLGSYTPEQICGMTLSEMVATNPDGFRMVMKHTSGGGAARTQLTSSESMGFGMLMLAILAGQDIALEFSVKAYFDGMFRSLLYWHSGIPVNGRKSHLMAWQLIQLGGAGTPYLRPLLVHDPTLTEEDNSATDGDLDMAYALLLADKQWGSCGKYDYRKYALSMINDIWEICIDSDSVKHKELGVVPNYHIKTGDFANSDPHWVPTYGRLWDITRPSDFMLSHIKVFKTVDPAHDWQKVIDATYECIRQLCSLQPKSTGLLPDFAMFDRKTKSWIPLPGTFEHHWENPWDGEYHQNACRTPLRLAMDYMLSGETPIDEVCLVPLNKHLKATSGGDFTRITGYELDGTPRGENTPYYSNPPLALAAALGDKNWLDNGWEYAKDLKWHNDRYGSYLNVLALIVASGNYWSPVSL